MWVVAELPVRMLVQKEGRGKGKALPTSSTLVGNRGSLESTHQVLAYFGHRLLLVVPGLPAVSSFWQFPCHEARTAEQGLYTFLGTNRKAIPELGNSRTARKYSKKKVS